MVPGVDDDDPEILEVADEVSAEGARGLVVAGDLLQARSRVLWVLYLVRKPQGLVLGVRQRLEQVVADPCQLS